MEKRNNIIRIAITGPESSGKTTLAKQLALHFNTVWVPEYARKYLNTNGNNYNYNDLEKIARGQLLSEKKIMKSAKHFLFADTEMLVIKIWSQYKYGKCSQWILDTLKEHRYNLFLLCKNDLPWAYDSLRENPDITERNILFEMYKTELENYEFPYVVISGKGEKRINAAINAVLQFKY